MYSLLVVDDEVFAVKGIIEGIDWNKMGIDQVFEAYDADQALEIIKNNKVDVLLCDIEMPGLDGIQMLNIIKKDASETLTIFLTGHAKFSYAQEAIKLGCYDYLLKPIDHEKIKDTVGRALKKIEELRTKKEFLETYRKYFKLWQRQQPLLIERFWQDLFSKRFISDSRIEAMLNLYQIPVEMNGKVLPILLSIEDWKVPLSDRDEEVMKYALRNVAAEILFCKFTGVVFQHHDGNNIVVIYSELDLEITDILKELCQKIITYSNENLHCSLSCYLGVPQYITELDKSYAFLLEMERNNLNKVNSVHMQKDFSLEVEKFPPTPPFEDWKLLLEMGKKDELIRKINLYFENSRDKLVSIEMLESFYSGLIHMVYKALHQKNVSVRDINGLEQITDFSSIRSLIQLEKETIQIIKKCIEYFEENDINDPVIIEKIKTYIKENIQDKLNRRDIANHVYLNPAYVSRLFKKETEMTLTEYITKLRIKEAKRLLIETNDTITAIAEAIGYYNYSYFSKTFKELVGVTPWEYRKNYQKLT